MNDFWIVIADASRAIIFSKDKHDRRTILRDRLENPIGRTHTTELVSARKTRVTKKSGGVQSAVEPHTDPHEQRAVEFAIEMGELIRGAADEQEFDRLVLIAPAHFLGLLKARIGKEGKKRLVMSLAKELAHCNLEELQYRIEELVRPSVLS